MLTELQAIAVFVAEALWMIWPAFLLSIVLGVLIRALKLDGAITRVFEARALTAIVLATAVGAFSPFCSCTVIPIVSGLLLSGVPLAPIMAFWIAAPTMDPEIFALSVATIGWPLALARLGATLVLSLAAGYITLALSRVGWLRGPVLREAQPDQTTCCSTSAGTPVAPSALAQPVMMMQPAFAGNAAGGNSSGETSPPPMGAPASTSSACGAPNGCAPSCSTDSAPSCGPAASQGGTAASWWAMLASNLRSMDWASTGRETLVQTVRMGRWLVLAFVLEALITRYIPQAAIAGVLGTESLLAVPLAALVGVPLYLHNITALPIVSGLLAEGMQPGAAIAFLVAGPVTTIPAMTAVWGIVRGPVFALYLACGLGGALVLGWLTNLLFLAL